MDDNRGTPHLFHAPNARVGDVIPKYIDGTYQLFYLKGWCSRSIPGWHRIPWVIRWISN